MPLPYVFAAVTTATGAQLDADLNAVGALTTILCAASGSNVITLTPAANTPTITAYGQPYGFRFGFVAAAASTGPVTALVGALAALKVFLPTMVQAGSGDIAVNRYYELAYNSTFDSGSGGFVIVNAIPTATATALGIASALGLIVTNNVSTPNTKVDISASVAIMLTTAGIPVRATTVAVTIDLTTVGANGMDIGSRPTSGWAYLYLISNGSVTAGLATASSPTAAAPTMPSGYIYADYVGAMFLDGSQNLLRSRQLGNHAQYKVTGGTNTAALPNIANGVAGTYSATAPVWATPSIVAFVPLTAAVIAIVAVNKYNTLSAGFMQVAPSNAYSGNSSVNPGFYDSTSGAGTGGQGGYFEMQLESTTIAWAANTNGCGINCAGWTDYWVK